MVLAESWFVVMRIFDRAVAVHVWEVPLDASRLMIPESSADDAAHLHRDGCRIEKLRLMFQSLAGTLRVSVIWGQKVAVAIG